MIDAYMKGQDLYAVIAQSAFDNNYEDNLEFYPEFTELNEIGGRQGRPPKKSGDLSAAYQI